mmetsp:Transcript_22094/g.44707  ORF Transcript_22094/g.44707 Transcript_22094/m.44707 type:complete len:298 (+) Transcript_22094:138-1031(+)
MCPAQAGTSLRQLHHSLHNHLRLAAVIKLEEVSFGLGNSIHLSNQSSLLCLFLTVVRSLCRFRCLVLEELHKRIPDWVRTTVSSTPLETSNGGVKRSLLQRLIVGELSSDILCRLSHERHLLLFSVTGFLHSDHVQHALHLGLEVMLRLDGTSSIQVDVCLLPHLVDSLKVIHLVLVGLEELELLLKCLNDLILRLVVLLQHGLRPLIKAAVDGITTLRVQRDAERNEDRSQLGLLVDDVPVKLDNGDGSGDTDRKRKPLRQTSAEEAALAHRGGSLGLLLLTGRRGVESHGAGSST